MKIIIRVCQTWVNVFTEYLLNTFNIANRIHSTMSLNDKGMTKFYNKTLKIFNL